MTVLKDVEYTYDTTGTYEIFKNVTGMATLDLNGKTLTLISSNLANTNVGSYIDISASGFVLTDSTYSGNAVDANGKEMEGEGILTAGMLKIQDGTLRMNGTNGIKIENTFLEIQGTYLRGLPNYGVYSECSDLTINNAVIDVYVPDSIAATACICAVKKKISFISSIVTNHNNNANGYAVYVTTSAEIDVYKSTLKSPAYAVYMNASSGRISDGWCEGSNAIYLTGRGSLVLDGGVYTGNLTANTAVSATNGSVIEILNGYFKGTWSGRGSVSAPHSDSAEGYDEYSGYTKYTLRTPHVSTISISGISGAVAINKGTGSITEYEGETITYQLTCMTDYEVTKVTYNGQSVDNYTKNGLTFTYAMQVPTSDYTLDFEVMEVTDNKDVASINDVKYDSLSTAMLNLQNGQTVKLLKDIDFTSVLIFNKENIILDLNGKELSMSVGTAIATV
jgi:hypothetical protein